MNKKIQIIGGGTVAYIRNHLALCAPAYGTTAMSLFRICHNLFWKDKHNLDRHITLTNMAAGHITRTSIDTNEDVERWITGIKADPLTKIVFFNCALVDWEPNELVEGNPLSKDYKYSDNFSKYETRLKTKDSKGVILGLMPSKKLIGSIREGRKDIFLVGFKTTCGAAPEEMFKKGLRLCKESSCNLVLVNDTKHRYNMIVAPEEAVYSETSDREKVLNELVEMAILRSNLTFTQSTVVDGKTVAWDDSRVPESLRVVVNQCIVDGAYKPFNGATAGHFAVKLSDTEFLTSIRKSNFNDLSKIGLVYVRTDGPDTVLAYGAKPSVGGQSQRIVFKDHPGFDCIVHAHVPFKENHPDDIPVRSQREFECGSHECGKNTSNGLKQFGNLKAVYLENHGPNIVFNKNIDPQEVLTFIQRNFNLQGKTGGYNL